MNTSIFRVEALGHKKDFTLLGIREDIKEAKKLANLNDIYFVRIVDCQNDRKVIYSNHTPKDLQQAF